MELLMFQLRMHFYFTKLMLFSELENIFIEFSAVNMKITANDSKTVSTGEHKARENRPILLVPLIG